MEKLLAILMAIITVGAAGSALAGPDWQVIEHARQVKAERWQHASEVQHEQKAVQRDDASQNTRITASPSR